MKINLAVKPYSPRMKTSQNLRSPWKTRFIIFFRDDLVGLKMWSNHPKQIRELAVGRSSERMEKLLAVYGLCTER